MLSNDDIKHLAQLARISLSQEEEQKLMKDLGGILGYVSEIGKVVTEAGEPSAGELRNVMREDESREGGAYTGSILANAPQCEGKYLKVKQIF